MVPGLEQRRDQKIAGYLLGERLGKGRFGDVRTAQCIGDGEKLACKIAEGAEGRRLLRQEAAMQLEITRPYRNGSILFPAFREIVETQDQTFLFMEYVVGISLKDLLHKGRLSEEDVLTIGIALAEGLQNLHERMEPILYRDLKPEHVMLCCESCDSTGAGDRKRTCGTWSRVRLLDLGCACRQSEAWKSRAGSRGYAAPEQLNEDTYGQGVYSDIYSFGKLLEAMSGGRFAAPEKLALQCVAEVPQERIPGMRFVLTRLRRMQEAGGRRQRKSEQKDVWTDFRVETCVCDNWMENRL